MPSTMATIASPPTGTLTPFIVTWFLAASSPAFAAGLPLICWRRSRRATHATDDLRDRRFDVHDSTPSHACCACPLESSCSMTERAVSDGIANPTPTFAFTVPPWI